MKEAFDKLTKKIRDRFGNATEKVKEAFAPKRTSTKFRRRIYFKDVRGHRYLPSGAVYEMRDDGWRRTR